MRALVKREREPGLWMEEVPRPDIGPNDLLIKITKTAICGTDLHIFNWDDWAQRTIPTPLVTGHEFVGQVAEVGAAVDGYKVGDRVSGEGHITCGHCRNCRAGRRHLCRNTVGVGVQRAGCFGEYLCLPAGNAFPIPDDISDDMASIFDPFGNATHTALAYDLVGEDVLITGAGPIGIMAAAICRHVGARQIIITDVNDYRLELAKQFGVDRVVNPTKDHLVDVMRDVGMAEGFDVGLEMSGNPAAFRSMLSAMNNGGRIALLGILPEAASIDWDQVVFKGLTIQGIYGREMFETWYKMKTMLQRGLKVQHVITHHFTVAQWEEAFSVIRSGSSGKVILDWTV
jgi:threonine 3-dehydrogenase